MSEFTPAVVVYDAGTLEQQVNEEIEASIEGWSPARAGLVKWVNKARSRIDALLLNQTASSSAAMFKKFGETMGRVPPILAAPASATSTWTAIDNAGYVIEAGTEVAIPVNGNESKPFVVLSPVEIPPGSTATAAGEVLLQALAPGTASNELTGEPRPVTQKAAFVESIALAGETSGGVDEEDEDAYLNRLTEEMQLLSLSLIVARDFEIDARSYAGIARALCIPGYKADTKEANMPLCFTVFPLDTAGLAPSAPKREELQQGQAAQVPSGVLNFVDVPTYTTVDVAAVAIARAGFDPAAVKTPVAGRLADYLSPANFGAPTEGEAAAGWVLKEKVYVNEVMSELDRVNGVERVVSVLLGVTGAAFTSAAATDVFTFAAAHGFLANDAVVFRSPLTGTAPLAATTVYYVRDITEKTFKVSLTPGGAAVNVTSDGSGTAVRMRSEDVTLAGVAPLPTLKTSIVTVQ